MTTHWMTKRLFLCSCRFIADNGCMTWEWGGRIIDLAAFILCSMFCGQWLLLVWLWWRTVIESISLARRIQVRGLQLLCNTWTATVKSIRFTVFWRTWRTELKIVRSSCSQSCFLLRVTVRLQCNIGILMIWQLKKCGTWFLLLLKTSWNHNCIVVAFSLCLLALKQFI